MSAVRGWCPGALRPMESGDGLIVRLRLPGAEAPLALALEIATWAEAYGAGALDLTSRANLQIRGVRAEALPDLTAALAHAGLLDAAPDAEAVRNVMVAPLADVDPAAPFDVRPHALALERTLSREPALWALPGKFGFAFDAGEHALGETGADVTFHALAPAQFVVSLAGEAFGPVAAGDAVEVARAIALPFLATEGGAAKPRRLAAAVAALGSALFAGAAGLRPMRFDPPPRLPLARWIGAQPLGASAFVGAAAPFGRICAADLRALAWAAASAGAATLRLTPFRTLIVPGLDLMRAERLSASLSPLDLILDAADPRLAVAACPGAPSCTSAAVDTRDAARRLAPLFAGREGIALHVSGCAKGCAHPKAAPFTIVGGPDGFALVTDGRAGDPPRARGLSLDALAARLAKHSGAA